MAKLPSTNIAWYFAEAKRTIERLHIVSGYKRRVALCSEKGVGGWIRRCSQVGYVLAHVRNCGHLSTLDGREHEL